MHVRGLAPQREILLRIILLNYPTLDKVPKPHLVLGLALLQALLQTVTTTRSLLYTPHTHSTPMRKKANLMLPPTRWTLSRRTTGKDIALRVVDLHSV